MRKDTKDGALPKFWTEEVHVNASELSYVKVQVVHHASMIFVRLHHYVVHSRKKFKIIRNCEAEKTDNGDNFSVKQQKCAEVYNVQQSNSC